MKMLMMRALAAGIILTLGLTVTAETQAKPLDLSHTVSQSALEKRTGFVEANFKKGVGFGKGFFIGKGSGFFKKKKFFGKKRFIGRKSFGVRRGFAPRRFGRTRGFGRFH